MSSVPTLYNAWFCPFAQRAWLALLEKGVEFTYVEQDPYNKSPEWLAVNPRGLVPAIVHNGKDVYESPVCIEYVDEAWKTDKHLLPSDPFERARVRIQSDHVSKKVVPPFYQLLMKKEEMEHKEAAQNI
jgi:glutathione S-transferase